MKKMLKTIGTGLCVLYGIKLVGAALILITDIFTNNLIPVTQEFNYITPIDFFFIMGVLGLGFMNFEYKK